MDRAAGIKTSELMATVLAELMQHAALKWMELLVSCWYVKLLVTAIQM